MNVAEAIRTLAGVAPDLAARVATFAVTRTKRRALRTAERAVLARGTRFEIELGRDRIAAWSWGSGPVVHLVHGWNGHAGQLGAFVAPLVASGMRVIAHDAIGHGASTGAASDVVAMADGIARVVRATGRAHAIIAHSLGGAATAIALSRGVRVDRVTLIGSPADTSFWPEQVFGLDGAAAERARIHAERKIRARYEDLSMHAIGRIVATPLLVVHDHDDTVVPFAEALATVRAFRDAGLLATTGLGHTRVLRDPSAIEEVVRFSTVDAPTGFVARVPADHRRELSVRARCLLRPQAPASGAL